jgi:hypothetical protein
VGLRVEVVDDETHDRATTRGPELGVRGDHEAVALDPVVDRDDGRKCTDGEGHASELTGPQELQAGAPWETDVELRVHRASVRLPGKDS